MLTATKITISKSRPYPVDSVDDIYLGVRELTTWWHWINDIFVVGLRPNKYEYEADPNG